MLYFWRERYLPFARDFRRKGLQIAFCSGYHVHHKLKVSVIYVFLIRLIVLLQVAAISQPTKEPFLSYPDALVVA